MKKLITWGITMVSPILMIGQTSDHIKFTAKISNRNSDSLVIKGPNKFSQTLKVDKKGMFSANLQVPKGFYMFSDGVESSNFFLKPKAVIHLVMDAKQFDESIVYEGKEVGESNYLAQKALREEQILDKLFTYEPNQISDILVTNKKEDLDRLEQADLDGDFKISIKRSIESFYQYAQLTFDKELQSRKLVGKPSPDFDYENFKGGKTKLSDLLGKFVYIDLWATWCGPCRVEIPHLQKMEEMYKDKNNEFVSISIDKAKDYQKWRKFVEDKNLGGIQLFADKDWESDFVVKYGVTGIPRFILIDPKGNIISSDASRPSSEEIKKQLDLLL